MTQIIKQIGDDLTSKIKSNKTPLLITVSGIVIASLSAIALTITFPVVEDVILKCYPALKICLTIGA